MSKTEKNLSQIIKEAQITILDSEETPLDEKIEESSSSVKDALISKCRETIEVICNQNLYLEIESQKRLRREAELSCREQDNKVQSLEKRLKESNSKVLELKEENQKLYEVNASLKKTSKILEKNNSAARINEELEEEIINTKLLLSEKNQLNTELNNLIRALETKMQKIETENEKWKENIEELQQENEDLSFKCERLATQAKIAETITFNLKQAQEDYQKYLREEKENFETKEKELKERFEQLEGKLKKRYQSKEFQLKQEICQSIEEIKKSIEINDNEHEKTRSENMNYKETIKTMQENFNILEHSLRDQIDKVEQELYSAKVALKEKITLLERVESMQKFEKNNIEKALQKEKDLEAQLRTYQEKLKSFDHKQLETKKSLDQVNSELYNLKLELQREKDKSEAKTIEIAGFLEREQELQTKIKKLKEDKAEETKKNEKIFEERIENNASLVRQQISRELDVKIEGLNSQIQDLQAENKNLRGKLDSKNSEMQKIRTQKEKFQQELKENSREVESHHDDSLSDEVYILKQKLAKLQKQKNSAEQKLQSLKEEYSALEEKIKQDSSFFRNETLRKDEEFNRLKKKFETKLREIYAENSLVTEQIRTDLLRLNNEVRNRESKDSIWISKNIEDIMRRIPSY